MKYEKMQFTEIRDHSAGYKVVFENGMPKNIDVDISDNASERTIEDFEDSLFDRDTKLCKGADGKLYKVVGYTGTAVKMWAEVELIPNKGERLKQIREFCAGTLQNAQEKTGIPFQNISRWETGTRDIAKASGEMLLKLAEAFGVTIEELIK